jgi:hypothetical protein
MPPGFALHQAAQFRFGFFRQPRGSVSVDQTRNLARGALAQGQLAFLEPAVAVGAIDDRAGEGDLLAQVTAGVVGDQQVLLSQQFLENGEGWEIFPRLDLKAV